MKQNPVKLIIFLILAGGAAWFFLKPQPPKEQETIVSNFYRDVSGGNYEEAWKKLTKDSREKIIWTIADSEHKVSVKKVREDVKEQGKYFNYFWDQFKKQTKAEEIYSKGKFKITKNVGNEVIVNVKSGSIEQNLKVKVEESRWRIDLADSVELKYVPEY